MDAQLFAADYQTAKAVWKLPPKVLG